MTKEGRHAKTQKGNDIQHRHSSEVLHLKTAMAESEHNHSALCKERWQAYRFEVRNCLAMRNGHKGEAHDTETPPNNCSTGGPLFCRTLLA